MQRLDKKNHSLHCSLANGNSICHIFLHSFKVCDQACNAPLGPPWISVGAEVCLSPWCEEHGAIVTHISMGQGQRQGSWATEHLTLIVVVRIVAWADKLILSRYPRHDTAQVGAHRIEAIAHQGSAIRGCNEVRGVALEPLGQIAGTWLRVGLEPVTGLDVGSKDVTGRLGPIITATSADDTVVGAEIDEY
uniref:Uncharacterized protein n=1 Tax=Dunaliella tertiolecta TaxID=3047 RepID=A0A7S3VRK4_DUNTE